MDNVLLLFKQSVYSAFVHICATWRNTTPNEYLFA